MLTICWCFEQGVENNFGICRKCNRTKIEFVQIVMCWTFNVPKIECAENGICVQFGMCSIWNVQKMEFAENGIVQNNGMSWIWDVQKRFVLPRQNLQFDFRVASLFVVLCMYLSSYVVVCADLVCILWVSTIHMCPWGIIFSIYHNSARLRCLTRTCFVHHHLELWANPKKNWTKEQNILITVES